MAIIFCGNAYCKYNELWYCQSERIETDNDGICMTQEPKGKDNFAEDCFNWTKNNPIIDKSVDGGNK